MAIYHLAVKTVSRSTGRTAVGAAAYRAAARIENARDGVTHDYTRRRGVEATMIIAPAGAEWAADRSLAWNLVEAAETRKNSCVAREVEVALPHELSAEGRLAVTRAMTAHLVERYGVVAEASIHAPHPKGARDTEPGQVGDDPRNWHVHILTSTRTAGPDGMGAKVRILDAQDTRGAEVEHMREQWAAIVNRQLDAENIAARVDHRSHAARGLDRAPGVHLGPAAAAMERRDERTDRGDQFRQAQIINLAAERAKRETPHERDHGLERSGGRDPRQGRSGSADDRTDRRSQDTDPAAIAYPPGTDLHRVPTLGMGRWGDAPFGAVRPDGVDDRMVLRIAVAPDDDNHILDTQDRAAQRDDAERSERDSRYHTGASTPDLLPGFYGRPGITAVVPDRTRFFTLYEGAAEDALTGKVITYRSREDARQVAFVDLGAWVEVRTVTDEAAIAAAMQLAAERFGGRITVTGPAEFKALAVELAARDGYVITNPELQLQVRDVEARLASRPLAEIEAEVGALARELGADDETMRGQLEKAVGADPDVMAARDRDVSARTAHEEARERWIATNQAAAGARYDAERAEKKVEAWRQAHPFQASTGIVKPGSEIFRLQAEADGAWEKWRKLNAEGPAAEHAARERKAGLEPAKRDLENARRRRLLELRRESAERREAGRLAREPEAASDVMDRREQSGRAGQTDTSRQTPERAPEVARATPEARPVMTREAAAAIIRRATPAIDGFWHDRERRVRAKMSDVGLREFQAAERVLGAVGARAVYESAQQRSRGRGR